MFVIHVYTWLEIGVHRNTIRNCARRRPAKPGPGKGLMFTPEAFATLCREFQLNPEHLQTLARTRTVAEGFRLDGFLMEVVTQEGPSKVLGSVMVVGGGIAAYPGGPGPGRSGLFCAWWKRAPASAAR